MTAVLFRDATAARAARIRYRDAADRLQQLAIDYRREGLVRKAQEACRAADRAFRAAKAEEFDPEPKR